MINHEEREGHEEAISPHPKAVISREVPLAIH